MHAHGRRPGVGTPRIADVVPDELFRATWLYNHYYRPISIRHAMALPIYVPAPAAAPLTPREREVLEWVAAGKTNRDIAALIGAKPRTVEKHLERIYEKLGVETRTAAAARARLL